SVLGLAALFARRRIASNTWSLLRWLAGSNVLPVALFLGAVALFNFGTLLLAHLIDLAQHQGHDNRPALEAWLGLVTPAPSPYRLHPFYPGLLTLVLDAAILVYFAGVVPLRSLLNKSR